MKHPRRKKVIYLLGAGFSFGIGAKVKHGTGAIEMPLQSTMWECLTKFNNRQPEKLDQIAKEIRKYFNPITLRARRKKGSSRHADLNGVSIEEVMTFLYDMMDRERNGRLEGAFKVTYDDLLIRTAELIAFMSGHADVANNNLLKLFTDQLIGSDTIITFNWDTLIDQMLEKRVRIRWKRTWGYGNSVRLVQKKPKGKKAKVPKRHIRLLKLHGSVNWSWEDGRLAINGMTCPVGSERTVEMIPPRLLKPEISGNAPGAVVMSAPVGSDGVKRSKLYGMIWREAEEHLRKASQIVIVGYSFPAADYALTNMLRRAIGWQKAHYQVTPRIIIIDPNARELAERIQMSFKVRIPIDDLYMSLKSSVYDEKD